MRCVAIIEAERPGLDSVIIWDDGDRLVAFGYEEGRVKMTRPLGATTLEEGIGEVRDNFQLTQGQVTRVSDWVDTVARTEAVGPIPPRWGLER